MGRDLRIDLRRSIWKKFVLLKLNEIATNRIKMGNEKNIKDFNLEPMESGGLDGSCLRSREAMDELISFKNGKNL